jgi:hypothetical protein
MTDAPSPHVAQQLGEVLSPLLVHSLCGFAVLDANGCYVFASDSLCQLLQLERGVLLWCARLDWAHAPAPLARAMRCILAVRALMLAACRDRGRRCMSDFVRPDERAPLQALLAAAWHAGNAAAALRSDAFMRVHHACGAADGATGGAGTAAGELSAQLVGWRPVEVRVSSDGAYAYVLVQDARMPARLESRISDLLMYTSAHTAQQRAPCDAGSAHSHLNLSHR